MPSAKSTSTVIDADERLHRAVEKAGMEQAYVDGSSRESPGSLDTLECALLGDCPLARSRHRHGKRASHSLSDGMRPWFWLARGVAAVHVVSSRFSASSAGLSAPAVEARENIFYAFPATTISAQTNRSFMWIVYADEMTSQMADLAEALKETPNMRILKTPSIGGQHPQFLPPAQQLRLAGVWKEPPPSATSRVYLSTRLEWDEGLPRRAVDTLHAAARRRLPLPNHRPCYFCWVDSTLWTPSADHSEGSIFSYEGLKKFGGNRSTPCVSSGSSMLTAAEGAPAVTTHKLRPGSKSVSVLQARERLPGPIRARAPRSANRAMRTPASSLRIPMQFAYGIGLSPLHDANVAALHHQREIWSGKLK